VKPVDQLRLPSLTIFFPAYNDGGTIPSMVLTAQMAARAITDDYEIVVVDDGSQDYTREVLEELLHQTPNLKLIRHPQNRGYGAALRTGFAAAAKEWIFYTDGDGQYNPLELPQLVAALRPGVDVVNGYKIVRRDPLIRVILGNIYNALVKIAFGIRLKDVDCDYRLMRRVLFDALSLESNTGSICVEMIKKMQDAGVVFAEAPVHHYYRQYGISQFFNLRRLLRTARHLLGLWWKLVLERKFKSA
jgi:glycosyltransferase involved in cell wall biosynthesis